MADNDPARDFEEALKAKGAFEQNPEPPRWANGQESATPALAAEDFVAYMPQHTYVFRPTCEQWPAASVNARIGPINGTKASTFIDQHHAVEQMVWAPGLPTDIYDRLVVDGGWICRPAARVFNLYRSPIVSRKPGDAKRWLDHIVRLYGEEAAAHIVRWLAHRVQRPGEKVNHALVLGGRQGIGKDMLLEPVRLAVGPWNFHEVSPTQLQGRFNGFLKSVVLRISEARDLGEVNRFALYEHTKSIIAAPPETHRIDEKNLREYAAFNVCGVIFTTNHLNGGLYLPADDRRHFVAWSDAEREDTDGPAMFGWYATGGIEHVADHLANIDLSGFDPKAPPQKTVAFWQMVNSASPPEVSDFASVLEEMGQPDALTIRRIKRMATDELLTWLTDIRNRKAIPHRLEDCGYVRVDNPDDKQGLWKFGQSKQAIYSKAELSISNRIVAARKLLNDRN